MSYRIALLILALICLPAGAVHAQQEATSLPSVTLPADLDRVLRDYERAWGTRDAAALAALFHENGYVLPGGRPPVHGRAAIRSHYQGAGGVLHLRAIDYAAQETVAFIIGMFGPAPGVDGGKFVLTLRRTSRSEPWLIASDMDSPNYRAGGQE